MGRHQASVIPEVIPFGWTVVHKSKNMEIVLAKEVGADMGFAEEAMNRL